MDNNFFSKDSWKRSMGPAVRVFAYTTMIYVLVYILSLFLSYVLLGITGSAAVSGEVTGYFMAVGMLFGFTASFFKVMDEQSPGSIQLDMA